MADNSLQGGTDLIRDLDRSGTGPKTQVFQIDHGGTGASESLTSRTNPFPVGNVTTATGSITATDALGGTPDGNGTPITTAPTAASFIAIAVPMGAASWTLLLTGYTNGTVYTESSVDTTNGSDGAWVPVKGRKTGTAPGTEQSTYAQVANGEYRGNSAALLWLRARLVGGTGTLNVGVKFVASTAQGAGFTNSGLMGSGAIIGKVGIDQTTPGTTNLVQVSNASFALAAGAAAIGSVSVSNFPASQVVTLTATTITNTVATTATLAAETTKVIGTVNVSAGQSITANAGTGTFAISAASLPLPAGASTETTLAAVSGKLPASLAAKAGSASLSVVPATDAYSLLPATTTNTLLSAAATTNATLVKGSAGALKAIQGYNAKATAVYLKFYNKATAPAVGTDTPVKTFYIPAASAFVFDFPAGYNFSLGIGYGITGAAALADTTALVAGDVICLNIDYI